MEIFAALADPTRRTIVEMLAREGSLSATNIYAHFSVSPPAISQHLKVLREANVVLIEKRAQQRIYRLNPDTLLELDAWVKEITKLWSQRFDALEMLLEAEKKKSLLKSATNQTTPSTEVTFSRSFAVPRASVFKAWTDPKQLEQWWSPNGFTNQVSELEERSGNTFLIHVHGADGLASWNKLAFHEIVEPERLVILTSAFEDEAGNPQLEVLNTVTFIEHDGQTQLSLQVVVVKSTPVSDLALATMEIGWNQSLDKLAIFLTKKN